MCVSGGGGGGAGSSQWGYTVIVHCKKQDEPNFT